MDKRYDKEAIEKLIAELKEQGLVDDAKFAKLWARARILSKPRAVWLIKKELIARGVDSDAAQETIAALEDNINETELIKEVVKKRLWLSQGIDKKKQKQRIYLYLKRRGFGDSNILKVLNKTIKQEGVA